MVGRTLHRLRVGHSDGASTSFLERGGTFHAVYATRQPYGNKKIDQRLRALTSTLIVWAEKRRDARDASSNLLKSNAESVATVVHTMPCNADMPTLYYTPTPPDQLSPEDTHTVATDTRMRTHLALPRLRT